MRGEDDPEAWSQERSELPIHERRVVMAVQDIDLQFPDEARDQNRQSWVEAWTAAECEDGNPRNRELVAPESAFVKAADAALDSPFETSDDIGHEPLRPSWGEAEHDLHDPERHLARVRDWSEGATGERRAYATFLNTDRTSPGFTY